MAKKTLNKIAKHLEEIEKLLIILVGQTETQEIAERLEGIEEATKSLARLGEELVEVFKAFRPHTP